MLGRMAHGVEAHESGLPAFVCVDRRRRFRELLKTSRGRKKLRAQLAHFADIDPAVVVEGGAQGQARTGLGHRLRELGAGDSCYLLAEDAELDGREMPLEDALASITAHEHLAAFVSCLPGRLAYFHGEEPEERLILLRHA
jgi:hypothetical protein